MKNPFESKKGNAAILIACLALGIYFATKEEMPTSFIDIAFLGFLYGFVFLYLPLKFLGLLKYEYDRRIENGIDLDAVLDTDPDVVKGRMMELMYYGHPDGDREIFNQFNFFFRNYPQWELHNWEVFRAWYKNYIDFALTYPDIYTLTNKEDGSPYCKENDSLYDPDALEWDSIRAMIAKAYADDEEEEKAKREKSEQLRDRYSRALGIGMGVGIANGLFGGNGS